MDTARFMTAFFYPLLGLMMVLLFIIYSIIFIPIFLYRWIITKLVAPRFRPAIGKAVTVGGHFMASEMLPERNISSIPTSEPVQSPPRSIIVSKNVFLGCVTYDECAEWIQDGWLDKRKGDSDQKYYPEFQQYLESWMGFMFWKPDKHFALTNHLHVHRISDEDAIKGDSETVLNNLLETLLNKPFPQKRSPWEVHLLQNYRNRYFDDGEMTVMVIRMHHGMADGFSLMYACFEGLANLDLNSLQTPEPKTGINSPAKRTRQGIGLGLLIKKLVYVPTRFLYDAGYFAHLTLRPYVSSVTPWLVPHHRKTGKTLYCASEFITVDKIKLIKTELGVNFSSVILSCLAAGAAEMFKRDGYSGLDTLPVMSIVPWPGHPKELRNHSGATIMELVTSPNLNPLRRLKRTNKNFLDARHLSMVPFIFRLAERTASSQLAPVAKRLFKNRSFPGTVSNFAGPSQQIEIRGRKLLTIDTCAGLLPGVAGVMFLVMSYHKHVKVSVTVENGLMGREELVDLVGTIEREINILYEMAVGKTDLI